MSQHSNLIPLLNPANSLFVELLENLLEIDSGRIWLQKVVNLLKQYVHAKHVILQTYVDNLVVCGADDLSNVKTSPVQQQENNQNIRFKPYWLEEKYIVPLSLEGRLEINWDKRPKDDEIEIYNNIFLLLATSLKNRANYIYQEQNLSYREGVFRLEKILNKESNLKDKLALVAREISVTLSASRCQIKVFSQSSDLTFDNNISSEFVQEGFVEAINVIPTIEKHWLERIYEGDVLVLDQRHDIFPNSISKDVGSLLSIRSMFGYPLLYKGKAIGVLILHECDYERIWKNEEILYLREISLLLSIFLGKDKEINENKSETSVDLHKNIIGADEFLRELGHAQIKAQISKSTFSLIMLDIERLNDINLKMGFVAGNLVLSQTARYLNRLYGSAHKIARYNNDEFVVIMEDVDQSKARIEAERLKEQLSNIFVLGIGPVDYNFSFVTFPMHASSIEELLTLLEQAMILSKSRGKSQISSFDEVKGEPKQRWHQLLSNAIPEIIIKKSSLKTGPEVLENIKQHWEKQNIAYGADILDSVQSLALALDAKDSYTEGHSKRVSEYAYLLAKQLSLDLQEIEWIRLAASMHDIGKIGIPESILCKPGKLTKEEYDVMKKHPVIGARILNPIKPLDKVANLVLHHHEYWNGSGYPKGLSKNEIPIGARIVSITDAYQAMTSNRPYRSTLPFEEAIKRLKDGKEKQWDPDLVDLFIKIVSC